jgi:sugar lactone lactonase YvrE
MNRKLMSLATAALLVCSTAAFADPQAETLRRIALPDGGVYPNGIAHAEDGTLYVGQITRGGVLRRSPTGEWSMLHEGAETIFAGTSLRLDRSRNILWGASPDFLPDGEPRMPHIFAIDATDGRVIQTTPLSDGFTNDIAIEPEGSILVTESNGGRLLRLERGGSTFQTVLQDDRLTHDSGIGAGGIARAEDGTVAIGNFSSGRIFLHRDGDLAEMQLPRRIENPDGMRFAPDGSLIVLESAVESGNGRVLKIADPLEAGERSIEILAEGLKSPVNLTVAADGLAYVSESHVRHRMIEGRENEVPAAFHVVIVPLG